MSYGKELRGIGGWLTFFLFTLGLFTPGSTAGAVANLSRLVENSASNRAVWDDVINWEWGLVILLCAACWFALWRFIFVKNWLTVQIGIATLWFIATLGLVIEPMMVSTLTGASIGDLVGAEGAGSMIRPLIYATIWTAYLLKSERVRNTYASQFDGDALAETFE